MDEDDDFRRAMAQAGVQPLAAGKERVERSPRRPPKERPGRPAGRFAIERFGERIEGLVNGGDRKQLRLLERGHFYVDLELDLHGASEDAARKIIEDAVEQAQAAGKRCLLVIHGRGHRSPGAPVLKLALPDWLTGPRCAAWVLAFVSAPSDLGGPGATLVLLRARRKR